MTTSTGGEAGNPHRREVGVDLLARILREAGVTRDEWLGG
jgi:hypothetical protein